MEAPFYIFRINTSLRRGWEIRDNTYRPILFIEDGLSYLLDSKKMADELCNQLNERFPKPKPRKMCPECQGYGEPDPGHPCSTSCRHCGGSGWVEDSGENFSSFSGQVRLAQ